MDPEISGAPDEFPAYTPPLSASAGAVPPTQDAPQPGYGPQQPAYGGQPPGYGPQQPYPPQPPPPGYAAYPPPYPYPQQPYGHYGYGYPATQQPGTNGFAVAALVTGICGFFWITPILGLIFGCVGISQCNRTGQQGKGMAIAGLVLSILWIALLVTMILIIINTAHHIQHYDYPTSDSTTVYGMNLSTKADQTPII